LRRDPGALRLRDSAAVGWTRFGAGGDDTGSRCDTLALAVSAATIFYVWRIQEIFPVFATLQLPKLVSVAVPILYVLDRDRRRSLARLRHPVSVAVAVILVMVVASIPTSLYPAMSFQFLVQDFSKTLLLAALLTASVRSFVDVERFAWHLVLGASLFAAVLMALGSDEYGARLGGVSFYPGARTSYDPNDVGLFAVCTLPVAVYFIQCGARKSVRVLAACAAAFLIYIVVQTASRGAFLSLAAVAGFGLLRFRSIPAGRRMGMTVLAVVALVSISGDTYWQRVASILRPSEDYNWSGKDEVGRLEVWKRGIGYMADRPVLGVGARVYEQAEGTLSPQGRSGARGWKWSTAHNSFLQIGVELGVAGLAAFVAMFGLAYLAMQRIARAGATHSERTLAEAFSGMLVGYVVAGFFLSQAYSTYLYFTMGMLLGLAGVARTGLAPVPVPLPPRGTMRRGRPGALNPAASGPVAMPGQRRDSGPWLA
jgi:O-antigen ligase